MIVGRTSVFSAALARSIAAILLVSIVPGVKADCWIDEFGRRRCDRFSTAARIGIGIGFFVVFLALVYAMVAYRRRRAARSNLAYVQQSQASGGNAHNSYGGQPPYAPQYPPPAHGGPGGAPPYGYDPNLNPGFAPPAGLPPQYYPPPPGAPPVDQNKGSYHV